MKYIRTKDGIYEFRKLVDFETYLVAKRYNEYSENLYRIEQEDIIKQANTIEELCDAFVLHSIDIGKFTVFPMPLPLQKNAEINVDYEIYGAIWTDKGLIFVAKMNKKGELELL